MTTNTPIDWRMVLGLPPKRRFTAAELARVQAHVLNPTVVASLAVNLSVPLFIVTWFYMDHSGWPLMLLMLGFSCGLLAAAVHAWRNPTSRSTYTLYWLLPLGTSVAVGLLHKGGGIGRDALMAVWAELLVGTIALWLGIAWRHHYIASRLRELDERERAIEMARRLAAAQLEPHFLFNSLASLQHWVDGGDARAAPFLRSLTGYLRATLPMFNTPLHRVEEELQVVRRYLEVMASRLGPRLAWRIDVDASVLAAPLPPATLLTLVENAIEHGIEPRLGGGQLSVRGERSAGRCRLEVHDDGPGPGAELGSSKGRGLANVRERLTLAFGEDASLTLATAPAGGCIAALQWRTT